MEIQIKYFILSTVFPYCPFSKRFFNRIIIYVNLFAIWDRIRLWLQQMCIPMNIIPSNDSFKRRNLYARKNRLHLRKVVKSYINSDHFDFSSVLEVTSQFNTATSCDKLTRHVVADYVSSFLFFFLWSLDLCYVQHNLIALICITMKMAWIAVCDMNN